MLAEDGCSAVCVDLKEDLAQHTVDMINDEGSGAAVAVAGDITKAKDCERIVQTAIREYGRLDILVNNVGIMGPAGSAVDVGKHTPLTRVLWRRSNALLSRHIRLHARFGNQCGIYGADGEVLHPGNDQE